MSKSTWFLIVSVLIIIQVMQSSKVMDRSKVMVNLSSSRSWYSSEWRRCWESDGRYSLKVRRISEEDPKESPVDKVSLREIRKITPVRRNIKYEQTRRVVFETGEVHSEAPQVKKIFTSRDSFHPKRVCNKAKIYFCRICGQFPKHAKLCLNLCA